MRVNLLLPVLSILVFHRARNLVLLSFLSTLTICQIKFCLSSPCMLMIQLFYCISPNSSNTSRCKVAVSLNNDLENVLKWRNDWLVTFNVKTTKLLSLFCSRDDTFPSIHIGPSTLPEVSDFRLLGLDISTNASWERYNSGIAKSSSMRVGCLYRARKFLPPDAILYVYKTTIRPLMEYCCHI